MAHRGIGCQSRGVDGVESIHRRHGAWYKDIKGPEGDQEESMLSIDTPRAALAIKMRDDVLRIRRARESMATGGLSVGLFRIPIDFNLLIVFKTTTTKKGICICQKITVVFVW
jgi:hypothetical protein